MDTVTRHQATEAWLRAFAKSVRDRDFAGARAMCHEDVTGFGTVQSHYIGIDELQNEQWHPVWSRTEDFDFDIGATTIWADGELVVAISRWSSIGMDNGTRRPRQGRATIVLSGPDDGLRAVHTHFSMAPGYTA